VVDLIEELLKIKIYTDNDRLQDTDQVTITLNPDGAPSGQEDGGSGFHILPDLNRAGVMYRESSRWP
jgi:hypothetical protein